MRFGASFVLAVLTLGAVSCTDATDAGPDPIDITIDADSLFYGHAISAEAVLADSMRFDLNTPFTWTSSDTNVAVVDDRGVILGTGIGTATIRVTQGDKEGSATVRVVLRRTDGGMTFAQGSIGNFGECALTSTGAAFCRRAHFDTDTVQFYKPLPGNSSISLTAIFTAMDSQCGMTSAGEIYCWGRNAHWVFGSRTPTEARDGPVAVKTDIRFKSMMTSGHSSICGIRIDDDVLYCWGHNDSHQLGREPAVASDSNVAPVTGSLKAKVVSGSDIGACALDLTGAAWCWGGGGTTQLGTAAGSNTHIPQPVVGGMTFDFIAAGNTHQCALTSADDAYCWGSNAHGQLGIGTIGNPAPSGPQLVAGGHKFTSLMTTNKGTASDEGTCGITTAGDLLCWGLFEPTAIHSRAGTAAASPYHIARGMKFRSLSKRYIDNEVCAIAMDGRAFCW